MKHIRWWFIPLVPVAILVVFLIFNEGRPYLVNPHDSGFMLSYHTPGLDRMMEEAAIRHKRLSGMKNQPGVERILGMTHRVTLDNRSSHFQEALADVRSGMGFNLFLERNQEAVGDIQKWQVRQLETVPNETVTGTWTMEPGSETHVHYWVMEPQVWITPQEYREILSYTVGMASWDIEIVAQTNKPLFRNRDHDLMEHFFFRYSEGLATRYLPAKQAMHFLTRKQPGFFSKGNGDITKLRNINVLAAELDNWDIFIGVLMTMAPLEPDLNNPESAFSVLRSLPMNHQNIFLGLAMTDTANKYYPSNILPHLPDKDLVWQEVIHALEDPRLPPDLRINLLSSLLRNSNPERVASLQKRPLPPFLEDMVAMANND